MGGGRQKATLYVDKCENIGGCWMIGPALSDTQMILEFLIDKIIKIKINKNHT